MIVYIESNFIIELARLQGQHAGCEGILSLAEANRIKLVVPAFAVEEPYGTWGRKLQGRKKIGHSLELEKDYLNQSTVYGYSGEQFDDVNKLLEWFTDEERQRLNTTMSRILKAAAVVPLTDDLFMAAVLYQEDPIGLSPPDSIICASVLSHLANTPGNVPKCFLNKNRRDFKEPVITTELEKHGCMLITNFNRGFNYVNSQVQGKSDNR